MTDKIKVIISNKQKTVKNTYGCAYARPSLLQCGTRNGAI